MEQKTIWIGKAAATSAAYRPQPRTSPLYDEFCELQTFIYDSHASCRPSASLDQVQLRDVHLRCPDSPLAKHLRQRFYEMLRRNVKLGKQTLSEFRADKSTSTCYLHVLVSSDGQRLTLRARLLYDPVYLCVPAVEDGKDSPWNKLAFAESAMLFSMLAYKLCAQAFLSAVLAAGIVDSMWKDMPSR